MEVRLRCGSMALPGPLLLSAMPRLWCTCATDPHEPVRAQTSPAGTVRADACDKAVAAASRTASLCLRAQPGLGVRTEGRWACVCRARHPPTAAKFVQQRPLLPDTHTRASCVSLSLRLASLLCDMGFPHLPTCVQEHTRVGADTSQDIQLFGIGIQAEHCVLELCQDGDVTLTPVGNSRLLLSPPSPH